eukprot:23564_1
MESCQQTWKQLQPFPYNTSLCAQRETNEIVRIADDKFIVIQSNQWDNCNSIYMYQKKLNNWRKLLKYPHGLYLRKHAIAWNQHKKLIYINNDWTQFITLNFQHLHNKINDKFQPFFNLPSTLQYSSIYAVLIAYNYAFDGILNFLLRILTRLILLIIIHLMYSIAQDSFYFADYLWNIKPIPNIEHGIRLSRGNIECTFIENTLHYISISTGTHYIWNEQIESLQVIHRFKQNMRNGCLVSIPSQNALLFFIECYDLCTKIFNINKYMDEIEEWNFNSYSITIRIDYKYCSTK